MKYTITKNGETYHRNTAKDVAKLVGCSKSNIDKQFSRLKKEHHITNGYLIQKT